MGTEALMSIAIVQHKHCPWDSVVASVSPARTAETWLCFSICVTAGETQILQESALYPRTFSSGQVEACVRSPCPKVGFASETKSRGGTAR